MTYYANTKIVAFVGLPGAGKTVAVNYLTDKGYPKIYFGGIIYKAMNDAGIEITAESQQIFREEIREREGKDFVVKQVIQQIHELMNAGQHRIILDGLYSWTEYKVLKNEFPGIMSVFAVVASKRARHHRLANRPERPFTAAEAEDRDWTEIEHLEKGGPIAIADHYIINNTGIDYMHTQIEEALHDIEFYE
jgi:dephospho-CoA kinase